MVGAVVSRMVTVWVLVVVLPQVSVNDHVLVMTRLQTPPVWLSDGDTTTGVNWSGQTALAVTVGAG